MSNRNGKGTMSPYAPVRYRDHIWWKYAHETALAGRITQDGKIG